MKTVLVKGFYTNITNELECVCRSDYLTIFSKTYCGEGITTPRLKFRFETASRYYGYPNKLVFLKMFYKFSLELKHKESFTTCFTFKLSSSSCLSR